MLCDSKNRACFWGEDHNDEILCQEGENEHYHGSNQNESDANFEDVFDMGIIFFAVFITENRGNAYGKSHKNRSHQKLCIQNNGNGSNTVASDKLQHDNVENIGRYSDRQIVDHFGRTIKTSIF